MTGVQTCALPIYLIWMAKKILNLRFRSLVTCGEGVRHPTTPIQGQSFVLIKSKFLEIGSKKHDFGIGYWSFACIVGFKVWLLNGCGPNLCFAKAFG